MQSFGIWMWRIVKKGWWLAGGIPQFLDFLSAYIPQDYLPIFISHYLTQGISWNGSLILFAVGLFLSVYLVHNETVLLFADAHLKWELEKSDLQKRINELEDRKANIRFKKIEDFSYLPSPNAPIPFPDLQIELSPYSNVDKIGLPGGVVIGAELKGMKKSVEQGELIWKITEIQLPPLFEIDEDDSGQFEYPSGSPIEKITDWKDSFSARYTLFLKVSDRKNPDSFAKEIGLLPQYHIVIRYFTRRGIDDDSSSHEITIEGNFQQFRDEICERWDGYGFPHLARLATCEVDN